MPLMSSSISESSNVMVFIDAGYLRNYAKEYCGTDEINYERLGKFLATQAVAGENFRPHLVRIFYYDAKPDIKDADLVEQEYQADVKKKIEEKAKELDTYIGKIQDTDKLDIKFGHLVISKKDSTRQKGVDTLIAIDMITKAFQGQYHYAVLLAGDADFIPIVEAVKHVGPIVVGSFFNEASNSDRLKHIVDKRIFMDKLTMPSNDMMKKIS